MKKVVLSILVVIMIVTCVFAAVACSKDSYVYVAENGSAGEDYAKEYVGAFGGEAVTVLAQNKIFMEIVSGTADIGFMDAIMANYYISAESAAYSGKIEIVDAGIPDESFAIGFRKNDTYLAYKFNMALYQLQEEGKINEIAESYNLKDQLIVIEEPTAPQNADQSSWTYVQSNGFKVGYTVYAPIAFPDTNNSLIGFDVDLAKAACQELGISISFVEIEWDQKFTALNSKNIDAIWNGFTYDSDRAQRVTFSSFYMKNKQVAVVKAGRKDIVKNYSEISK